MEEPLGAIESGDQQEQQQEQQQEKPKENVEKEQQQDEGEVEPVNGNESSPANESEDEKSETGLNDLDDYSLIQIFENLSVRDRARLAMVNTRWYMLMEQCWASSKKLSFKESFSLWGGQSLNSIILHKILKKCPLLREIDLCQTATTLDDKTCSIIGRCCPRLEKLVLRDAALNKYSVTSIGKSCPNLKSVDFGRCNNVTEKSLWGLLNLRPQMEELSLSNCTQVTGRCFYLCKNLNYLDLCGCSCVVADSFQRLAQKCSQTLKTLIAPPLSVHGLYHICKNFINLVRLEVDTTAAGFSVLAGAIHLSMLTKLEKLVFRPELIDLCDENFHRITSCLPKLTELHIFGTDRITDLSTITLPDHCPNIKILHLEGFKFGDTSLRCFARLKNLEQLTVSGSLITDDGAYHIMTHVPALELFGVNSCLGISLETLSNAYDLINEGLANNKLIICYNNSRIRISEFKDKSEIRRYESRDIWGSDQEYFDYRDCEEYDADDDDVLDPDDFFYDGDFLADDDLEYHEEELAVDDLEYLEEELAVDDLEYHEEELAVDDLEYHEEELAADDPEYHEEEFS